MQKITFRKLNKTPNKYYQHMKLWYTYIDNIRVPELYIGRYTREHYLNESDCPESFIVCTQQNGCVFTDNMQTAKQQILDYLLRNTLVKINP